jgi:hypothetical protein
MVWSKRTQMTTQDHTIAAKIAKCLRRLQIIRSLFFSTVDEPSITVNNGDSWRFLQSIMVIHGGLTINDESLRIGSPRVPAVPWDLYWLHMPCWIWNFLDVFFQPSPKMCWSIGIAILKAQHMLASHIWRQKPKEFADIQLHVQRIGYPTKNLDGKLRGVGHFRFLGHNQTPKEIQTKLGKTSISSWAMRNVRKSPNKPRFFLTRNNSQKMLQFHVNPGVKIKTKTL